eukprot:5408007-Pyramimonas_sp.AAC.1
MGTCAGCGRSACEDHVDASARRCSKCVLRKSERSAGNVREEETTANAAESEKGMMRLKAIITNPTP